jgi:RHS repeat-associated protein
MPKEKILIGYDSENRRTDWDVWEKDTSGTYVKQNHIRFSYDGANLISEEVAEPLDIALRRTYYWGVDCSGTLFGTKGTGALLMMTDHSSGIRQSWAYAYSPNSDVVALVDATHVSSARVGAEYDYGPFGEPVRVAGAHANVNPFRFSTKYQDAETGLLYYGYRYYQPSLGVWLSRDPLGEEGGDNLYAFLRNRSTTWIDIDGRTGWAPGPGGKFFPQGGKPLDDYVEYGLLSGVAQKLFHHYRNGRGKELTLTPDEFIETDPDNVSVENILTGHELNGITTFTDEKFQTVANKGGTLGTFTVILNGQFCKYEGGASFDGKLTIQDTFNFDPKGFSNQESNRSWKAELQVQLAHHLFHGNSFPVKVEEIEHKQKGYPWGRPKLNGKKYKAKRNGGIIK